MVWLRESLLEFFFNFHFAQVPLGDALWLKTVDDLLIAL